MRRVALLFPTQWDRAQLDACREAWEDRYEVVFQGPESAACRFDFDVLAFIDALAGPAGDGLAGVASSSDDPGAPAAAAVARARGLPGPDPAAVLRTAHKLAARRTLSRAVPEATPRFVAVDPDAPPAALAGVGFPCFVKPIKGAFSVFARRVASADELRRHLQQPAVGDFRRYYVALYDRLLARYADLAPGGGGFLAEELLGGDQVTVEGYVRGGRVHVLGIVDSVVHPETGSFLRFDLPSRLPAAVQRRMTDVCRRAVLALGLDETLWNAELFFDPAGDRLSIIEVNPRLCGQFADLWQATSGRNGYQVLLALASGDAVPAAPGGRFACVSSFPLRVFAPTRVRRVPGAAEIAEVEARFPGVHVWIEVESGDELRDFAAFEDGASCRYAVLNVAGRDRADVDRRRAEVEAALAIELEPLPAAAVDRLSRRRRRRPRPPRQTKPRSRRSGRSAHRRSDR